jgi:alkylated DNA nucleotide flippase Atl1
MSEEQRYKYRGTIAYFKVYAALVHAAEHRGVVTYQEIAQIMGLPLSGSYMGSEVGRIVGLISEDEVAYGRPMLSALVVGVNGKPGKGFFDWARELGRLRGDRPEDEERFWEEEKQAVYEVWQRKFKTK